MKRGGVNYRLDTDQTSWFLFFFNTSSDATMAC